MGAGEKAVEEALSRRTSRSRGCGVPQECGVLDPVIAGKTLTPALSREWRETCACDSSLSRYVYGSGATSRVRVAPAIAPGRVSPARRAWAAVVQSSSSAMCTTGRSRCGEVGDAGDIA